MERHSWGYKLFEQGAPEGPIRTRIQHEPDLTGMNAPVVLVPGTAVVEAIPIVAPKVNDEDPRPGLYLTTLMELFMRDQSPAQALCSLLAMYWFWPSDCEAEEKDLFLGSVLLSLRRFLKDKLACLGQDMTSCVSCKSDKQTVTMGRCAPRYFELR